MTIIQLIEDGVIVCPQCLTVLKKEASDHFVCSKSNHHFMINNGCFQPLGEKLKEQKDIAALYNNRKENQIKKLIDTLKLTHILSSALRTTKVDKFIKEIAGPDKVCINVGGAV